MQVFTNVSVKNVTAFFIIPYSTKKDKPSSVQIEIGSSFKRLRFIAI